MQHSAVAAGEALLDLVRASGRASVAVVGTAKNVGKTVTLRAMYEAAVARGVRVGLVSAGRDGEAIDAVDRNPKPRLRLVPGTWIASAVRTTRPLRDTQLPEGVAIPTACGPVIVGCVEEEDEYELVGPPTSAGLRVCVSALREHCELVLVDGAIDRLAAIASGEDAVVVSCGAAAGETLEDVVDEVGMLVARLRILRADPREPSVRIDGALLPERAHELLAQRETRQVIVDSPASIALDEKTLRRALEQLRLRCERPVELLAATVAPAAGRRRFEPQRLLHAVAEATGLPTYDVYAAACVKPSWTR